MPYKRMIHQERLYERRKDIHNFALFWEQGAGKSKALIDQAMYLYNDNLIDGLLVVAPPGCYGDWTKTGGIQKGHLEDHLTSEVLEKTRMLTYTAKGAGTKASAAKRKALLEHEGLAVLCMSYSNIYTKGGRAFAREFLEKRTCFYGLDESRRIKNPNGKQSNLVVASSTLAPYRWIMTGTPVSNGPLDIWKQMKFIDKDFWTPHGLKSFTAFKNMFGIWRTGTSSQGRNFEFCVGYKNLHILHEIIAPFCDRVLTNEVMELPEKNYYSRFFDLTPKQREVYDEMEKEFIVQFPNGTEATAEHQLTRLLRAVQITSNYIPIDDSNGVMEIIDKNCNPRMECFLDDIEDVPGKRIVWAEFNQDVDMIMDRLGKCAVRYDGQVTVEQRVENEERFIGDDTVTTIVSKQRVGGEGKNWQFAPSMFYYNCQSDLDARLQSERRNWRKGATQKTSYNDYVANNTINVKHIADLVKKQKDANVILGDNR